MDMTNKNDFYEEDESIEAVREAFEQGEKGVTTGPPASARGVFSLVRKNGEWSGNASLVTTQLVGQKSDDTAPQAF